MISNPKTVAEFRNMTKGLSSYYAYIKRDWDLLSKLVITFIEDKFSSSPNHNFFILDAFEDPDFYHEFNVFHFPALMIVNGNEVRDQTVPGMVWKTLESLDRAQTQSS